MKRQDRLIRCAIFQVGAVLLFSLFLSSCGESRRAPALEGNEGPARSPKTLEERRNADYLSAREKARAWFDDLKVDCADLLKHGVKGKKKLAEILDAYATFHRYTQDPRERDRILARVGELVAQTTGREYHNMGACSDTEFTQNSTSYLRTCLLMERFALGTGGYRREILAVKPRLDADLARRGPWQRAIFAEYYDQLGLEKPPILREPRLRAGVVSRRLPVEAYTDKDCYDLTHEVFVAFDYGLRRKQAHLSRTDLTYAKSVLPQLLRRYAKAKNPDFAAELLSCMTYLGWHANPAYAEAVDFLLATQNATGTWGDYEQFRKAYGPYLEQHAYLHTTMVVMEALVEAIEADWPVSE